LGIARSLFNWATLAGNNLLGVGTHLKYYIEQGGRYTNITPIRRSVTLGTDPFSTTTGSAVVIVSDPAHGAADGDFVTLSGAVAFGGFTVQQLNAEHQLRLLTPNSYAITLATQATSDATGGGAPLAQYEISVGKAIFSGGKGYGTGVYGRSTWGSPAVVGIGNQLRLWSQDAFGEDLILNPRGGDIYFWDVSVGGRAVPLSTLPGATSTPTKANHVLVFNRFVILCGTQDYLSGDFDPLLVRWGDQESLIDFHPDITDQAGGFRLSTGSFIVTAKATKQEVLIWTDQALYSMRAVEGPVYSFDLVDQNVSIAGPNAAAQADNVTYWMGTNKFFLYTGRIDTLECSLKREVFDDFNTEQSWQVTSGSNERWNEIWWFYPSKNSFENDSYVVFNYKENVWYNGKMRRSAWIDNGVRRYPMAAVDGKVMYHEYGTDDAENDIPLPLGEFIESSDVDIEDGDRFTFVYKLLPDVSFEGSVTENPSVRMQLKVRDSSGNPYFTGKRELVERVRDLEVEEYTDTLYPRLRGRQFTLRIEGSSVLGSTWQLGTPRIGIRKDGRR
jgi:hypothetical protein